MEDTLEIIYDIEDVKVENTAGNVLQEQTTTSSSTMLTPTTPKKLVYMDHVYKGLEMAFKTEEHIILYGNGGFSKSLIVEDFFRKKGITPYVKTLGAGTTIDSVFGGMDIDLFMNGKKDEHGVLIEKAGKIEYLVENSFMNHEYVVLEEGFDAPDFILEQFKDILTAKEFRNGSQKFPIKTKLIVICTNKNRTELAVNSSIKALMERFPLEIKVEWDNYTSIKYDYMFMESFGKQNKMLSYICEELHKNSTTISPRTAVKCLFGIEKCGTDYLSYIAEFNTPENSKITKEAIKKYKALAAITEIEENTSIYVNELNGIDFTKLESITEINRVNTLVKSIRDNIEKIDKMKKSDEMIEKSKGWIEKWNKLIENTNNELKKLVNG